MVGTLIRATQATVLSVSSTEFLRSTKKSAMAREVISPTRNAGTVMRREGMAPALKVSERSRLVMSDLPKSNRTNFRS